MNEYYYKTYKKLFWIVLIVEILVLILNIFLLSNVISSIAIFCVIILIIWNRWYITRHTAKRDALQIMEKLSQKY